jgi:hypothetical protein
MTLDPGWKKCGSGSRDKHPGSVNLEIFLLTSLTGGLYAGGSTLCHDIRIFFPPLCRKKDDISVFKVQTLEIYSTVPD